MSWNYRIMEKRNGAAEIEYGIHEVRYDNEGKVECWTKQPVTPPCSSKEDLLHDLNLLLAAFKKETLQCND